MTLLQEHIGPGNYPQPPTEVSERQSPLFVQMTGLFPALLEQACNDLSDIRVATKIHDQPKRLPGYTADPERVLELYSRANGNYNRQTVFVDLPIASHIASIATRLRIVGHLPAHGDCDAYDITAYRGSRRTVEAPLYGQLGFQDDDIRSRFLIRNLRGPNRKAHVAIITQDSDGLAPRLGHRATPINAPETILKTVLNDSHWPKFTGPERLTRDTFGPRVLVNRLYAQSARAAIYAANLPWVEEPIPKVA